jgi:hypothetical protein
MTRDDYLGALLGLNYGNKVNSCADIYIKKLNKWLEDAVGPKLNGMDVWSPVHQVCFERANNEDNSYYFSLDAIGYVTTKASCKLDNDNLSDKLLIRSCQLIASDKYPTYWSNRSELYCKDYNDYNKLLETYYKDADNTGFNQGLMKDLLRDIL